MEELVDIDSIVKDTACEQYRRMRDMSTTFTLDRMLLLAYPLCLI